MKTASSRGKIGCIPDSDAGSDAERHTAMQINMPARETDPNELLQKFRKRNTPEFYGNEDLMLVDDFLVPMEEIFVVFECMKVQELQLIAYMFRGLTDRWWTTIKTIYDNGRGHNMDRLLQRVR